jgi:hypothetical protein
MRRFFSELPGRLEKAGRSDLINDFKSCVLPNSVTDIEWTQWISAWEPIFQETSELVDTPTSLSFPRKNYYVKAVTALSDDNPAAAAWLLMNCWTRSAAVLETGSNRLEAWKRGCEEFLQVSGSFSPVMEKLDTLLDTVEETLDAYASDNGLTQ